MLGWLALGIAAVGGTVLAFLKKHEVLPSTNKSLADLARNQDSVIVPILAVQPGFQSDTINAELAAIKAANVGKNEIRVEDIVIDGPGTARGVILGTPFSPTSVARIQLKDIIRIERHNPNNPNGFDIIAKDLVT